MEEFQQRMMTHDITHCNGADCTEKEFCFRYQAHLELQDKHLYGFFAYYNDPTKLDCYKTK